MLGKVDGVGVRDIDGLPAPHSYYEGVINNYYVFRRMGQTAVVEVSPNNQDSVWGEPNKNKIYERYKLQRIIDDVNMKRERDEYDMTAKLFKYCNLEEIKKKNEKPKKEKKITKPKKEKNEKPKKEKNEKPKKTKRLVKIQKKNV